MTGESRPARPIDSRFCVTERGCISWGDFLADAERARVAIRDFDAVCNIAPRRYDFTVLLAAAMLNGQTTILPPSRADRAIEAVLGGFSSPLMFEHLGQLALAPGPRLTQLDGATVEARLQASKAEVHVFTSGSTGIPVRHVKSWTSLAGGAELTAELIRRAGLDVSRTAVVGTTPHQHMYGLEATVFATLAHRCCLYDAPTFYPADIEAAVARAEALGFTDVVLVTSPPHLKFLEDTIRHAPRIRCVISATAPLHPDTARRLEAEGERVVSEIYGCTEAGSLAWRRSAQFESWELLKGFRISERSGAWYADAPHLSEAAELADEIELAADGRFRLIGRRGDMVSIAGKRQSLGALNAALATMRQIRDGIVIRETVDGEDRLRILVVPRELGAMDDQQLRHAVRTHMLAHFDAVFVPRAIIAVDCLPRDATGKITAPDIAALSASGHIPRPA